MGRFDTPEGKIPTSVLSLLFMAVIIGLAFLMPVVYEREVKRQDAVQEHNCKFYGAAINKHAGKEVCPPTPNG